MGDGAIYLDVETAHGWESFDLDVKSPEFRALPREKQDAMKAGILPRLGISYAGVLRQGESKPVFFGMDTKPIEELFAVLDAAPAIVGYDIWGFDYAVLQPLLQEGDQDIFDRYRDKTTDMLYMLEQAAGMRISLDVLAHANLKIRQVGKSREMPAYFLEGSPESLKKIREHISQNLIITGSIYELGREFGELKYYVVEGGKVQAERTVKVEW